ncbi:MAG: right-handed parallel beta-helix repeat-containing protein [Jannaschia sp.]
MTMIPAKGLRRLALLATLWAVLTAGQALAQRSFTVTPETLDEILAQSRPGDDIALAPGSYDHVVLREIGGGDAPVTLRSANPADAALIHRLTVIDGRNIALRDLHLSHVSEDGEFDGARPFRIIGTREIDLQRIRITGALVDGREGAALPVGNGLIVTDAQTVRLRDSTLSLLARGVTVTRSEDVMIDGNTLHSLRTGGMMFRQVTGVTIEGNTIRDFIGPDDSTDLATMIQFSTTDTTAPSRGIVIRDNLLSSGTGKWSQSIAMNNQVIDQNLAGPDMFYRDVAIEENLIINAHLNGIAVGATDGLLISRNTVVQNAVSGGWRDDPDLWTPQIKVADLSRDVIVLANVAHVVPTVRWQSDWVVAGNLLVQNRFATESNHYDTVFTSVSPTRPARPADFVARTGGALYGREIGAPRLIGLETGDVASPANLRREQQGLFEVLRFDPARGAITAFAGAGADELVERALGGTIEIGGGNAPLRLTPEMTAPWFGTTAFRMTVRLIPAADRTSAGEVLRIHRNLVLAVTDRGAIHADFLTAAARGVRLRSRPTRIFEAGAVNLVLSYDADVGLLTLSEDGVEIGEVRTFGPTRARESWGLSFGNPFANRKSFDGTVEAFALEVRHPLNKPWNDAGAGPAGDDAPTWNDAWARP